MFRATSAASLCFESVFEGGNREEGGLKRAAPTRSARSLRPGTKDTAARPSRPRCFGSARAQEAASESQQHKWDEHGARLLRASRERSRHGGDSRLRARWPLCPQSGCARFMALEPRNEPLARRSQHGGQPARARCSAWDIGRIGWARSRNWPTRAASRGARGGAGKSIPERCVAVITHARFLEVSRISYSSLTCSRPFPPS